MGFFKFLKRDKSKETDLNLEDIGDLDMPPEPPGIEKGGPPEGGQDFGELPELPEISKGEELFSGEDEPFPPLETNENPSQELEFPSTEAPKAAKKDGSERLQVFEPSEKNFPNYSKPIIAPKIETALPEMPRQLFGAQRSPIFGGQMPYEQMTSYQKPSYAGMTPYQMLERSAVREGRGILRHKEAMAPIFIRVERFRNALVGAKEIKNDLKIADESITRLNEIDANKERIFEKWHNVMADIQKKIIFMDKTLFKK